MLDPRIGMLSDMLAARRAELAEAVETVDPRLREKVPAEGQWSVAMLLEHMAQTEGAITKLLDAFARSAESRSVEEDFDREAFARHIDMPVFLDRTRKLKLSQPSGAVSAAAAWEMLVATRSGLLDVLERCAGLRLERLSREHPAGGALDGYQWVAFIGLHEARHAGQVLEIGSRLSATGSGYAAEPSA